MKKKPEVPNFRALYPRFIHFGVCYSDIERIVATAKDWVTFGRCMADLAEGWEKTAQEALKSGCKATAREQWRLAADYYHFAEIKLPDSLLKDQLKNATRRCHNQFLGLQESPAVRCEIPFEPAPLPGYLKIVRPGAPCVILIGGLDSAKEVELHYFAEVFARRSCSVLYLDGPGQGELCGRIPIPGFFEKAIAAAISFLESDSRVGSAPIGCFGVAFGGHLACRAAAANPRIEACVSMGGFFDSGILAKLPPLAKTIVLKAFGLSPDAGLAELAPLISLEPFRGHMKAPLLIVYGTADHLVDMDQISAMQAWASGPVETIILEGSEHACTDRFNECLPRLGDWMVGRLCEQNTKAEAVG